MLSSLLHLVRAGWLAVSIILMLVLAAVPILIAAWTTVSPTSAAV